ncbi:MAG: hypothetical protein J5760_03460, partial [Clostridia bacterium]|nr:hypothetical protein [Clostridia bacterium]
YSLRKISTAATLSPRCFRHRRRSARSPVAVPEIFRSLFASQNFDRCHSLASLLPPPAALGSFPTSIPIRICVVIADFESITQQKKKIKGFLFIRSKIIFALLGVNIRRAGRQ